MSYKSTQHLVDTTADRKSSIYDLTGRVLDGSSYTSNHVLEVIPTHECYLKLDMSAVLDSAVKVAVQIRPIGPANAPFDTIYSAGATSGILEAKTWVLKLKMFPYRVYIYMVGTSTPHTLIEGSMVATVL
jgi:hypothetical protein